ncbi:cysteine desulfurase [Candidatus Shapirobacteria bacterium]|nr:cysteine desulfurase [Candidatus Shapirobacteria bacterium]
MKKIYLDHAATTPVAPAVLKTMQAFFTKDFGNPSEPHSWGQAARQGIEEAREKVARFLKAQPSEIIFTSGATEAINLAHKGLIETFKNQSKNSRPHLITTQIEHKAVLETCRHLEKIGWAKVSYLPVEQNGLVKTKEVERAIRPETVLLSVMFVNNETGAVQPLKAIGQLLQKINKQRLRNKKGRIYFHTDATQAVQYFNCQVDDLGVDLLSLSGHKFYAPKGVGVLFIRKKTPLVRQQDGGGQEYRLRAGTENVPFIVGLGKAIELIQPNQKQSLKNTQKLRDRLVSGVLKIPKVRLVGDLKTNAPHIATFLVEGVEGEAMMLLLSEKGIAASSGSACTSGLLAPSHVLLAMGYQSQQAHGSLRFSLGQANTPKEIDEVLAFLPEVIQKLRRMAPKL